MENYTNRKKTSQQSSNNSIKPTTIIVGAGWAGLACAISLVQAKQRVIIIEASPQLGGRARTVKFAATTLDNGQHILIGAYTETIKLLKTIGIQESQVFKRSPLHLLLYGKDINIEVNFPNLPAPFQAIIGLIFAKGLTYQDKLAVITLFVKLYNLNFTVANQETVLTALKQLGQSENLINNLWEPIAIATMSTPITIASANVFFQILKDVFTTTASNSNWLLPIKDLSQILPLPAKDYLLAHHSSIILQQPIKTLLFANNNQCIGVANDQHSWYANNIVLATPAYVTARLLASTTAVAISKKLSQIKYNVITTIYLTFAAPVSLPQPIIGLLAGPIQWLITRSFTKQTNILSAIITDNDKTPIYHNNEELIANIMVYLPQYLPNLPKLLATKIIKEQRAAYLCTPTIQQLKPSVTTNIANLFLAGEHTIENYPATIESAIRSGINCAKVLIQT